MKKLSYLVLGAAGLMLASCSNEDVVSNVSNDGTATVTIDLGIPQIQTRSYSDGTTAQQLQYAVYIENGDGTITLLPGHTTTTDINIKKQVSFKLVTNRTYGFVFWAANENAPYNVSFTEGAALMSVDYSKPFKANDETLDAFYAYKPIEVKGDLQMSVELYRPFAQINVGANDLADAKKSNYEPTESHIKIKNVYGLLNLVTGGVDDLQDEVLYDYNALPDESEEFPVKGYDYIIMAYPLVDAEEATVNVSFDTQSKSGEKAAIRTVGSVPVKRNYRTNLYGQLFTNNVELYVEIKPAYQTPDYPVDGDENEFKIQSQLGGSITLSKDIAFENGDYARFPNGGTLDMNGKTISGEEDGLLYVTGGNLTIRGNGKISNSGTNSAGELNSIAVWANGGDVIIEDGEYYSENPGALIYISNNGGTVYIKGGKYKIDSENEEDCKFTLNCQDGTYPTKSKFVVTGGMFYNYDPSNSRSENPAANFVAEGYKSIPTEIDGETWYVVVPANVTSVASSADELKEAVSTPNSTVFVTEGTYGSLPTNVAKDVVIECAPGTVFEGKSNGNINGSTLKGATFTGATDGTSGTTLTSTVNGKFIDCNFVGKFDNVRWCYSGETCYFENCYFAGTTYACHFDGGKYPVTFKDCTFEGFTAMPGAIPLLTYENCVFQPGKSSYNGVNLWGTAEMIDCKFYFKGGKTEWIDAKKELTMVNCTINDVPASDSSVEKYFTTADYKNVTFK